MGSKFNWGWRIGLLYGGFVAMIIFMVMRASSEKVELVTKDYYEEELKYQDRINRAHMADSLHLRPEWTVGSGQVSVRIPSMGHAEQVSGTIKFYCPSDAAKDFNYPFTAKADSDLVISHSSMAHTLYRVNVEWSEDSHQLLAESVLKID
ncbi:MAG: FixH family protein [Bacteroidetes bacterium]|nr:FixH family protein [Bacteroidota bacterium]